MMNRTGLVVLPVLALLLGLTACGDEPDPDAVVRVAIGEPQHLVPTDSNDPHGAQVLSALFAPLVGIDEHGEPYPVAAASVEPDEDGRVWTVTLRDGFTFHDGEPVTADNYLDAWTYGAYQGNEQRNHHLFSRIEGYDQLNPRTGGEPEVRTLSGLEKIDDHTFTVTLSEPFGGFRSVLSAPAFYPLPATAFASAGVLAKEYVEAPVGNGPFRMVGTWQRGERIEVERYEVYPDATPRIGGVEFLIYEDPAGAYDALRDGDLDLVTRVPADRLPAIDSDLDGRYLQQPAPVFHYLAVPVYREEFADPAIRKAISMAIDREQIAEAVFRGSQTAARGFVAPVVPGARPDSCGEACTLNPTAAKQMYAAAGGPERITITYNIDGGHEDWVEATCEQLRTNLSIRCVADPEPTLADLLARVDQRDEIGLLRLGWSMDYPSMESYLAPVFSTTGSANFSGYRNAEFDELLATAASADSAEDALAAYQQAEDILAQDLPVIPLRFGQDTVGYSERLRDVDLTPLGHVDLTRLVALD